LKLRKEKNKSTKYAELEISEIDDVKSIREKVIAIRKSKLPEWRDIPNCGSFFKNPIVSKIELDKILNINKSIKYFTSGDEYKLSAAYLIESLDLKGYAMGGASISTNHALIIINEDKEATFTDVKNLSEFILNKVKEEYGVILEREVNMI
jgi:UDP-N-acetylmuramate dehydrogenase